MLQRTRQFMALNVVLCAATILPVLRDKPAYADNATKSHFGRVEMSINQISSHRRRPIILALRPAVFDRHVVAIHVARFVETFAERGQFTGDFYPYG
jgi:hypothetical protein